MPYPWVNRSSNATQITKLHEEYSKLATVNLGSIPVIAMGEVPRQWERDLSDMLFMVTGFSQFFGALAFQCHYKWSLAVPTAGAVVMDGKFFIVMNPLFVFNFLMKPTYRSFVIVHEVWHIFYEHGDRGMEAGYDPEMFNIACDHYIHLSMEKMLNAARSMSANVELLPDSVFEICHDKKYEGMTEDEIYHSMEEDQKKDQQNGSGSGESGESEGKPGKGSPSGGNGSGGGQGGFDAPIKVEESGAETSTKNKQAISSAVRAAAVQSSQCQNVGDAELGVIRRFLEVTEPKVDWRDQFADFFQRTRNEYPTYSHYNRRSTDEIILPTKEGSKINVFFGADSSGSMGKAELARVGGELGGIVEQIDTWVVTIASCDSKGYEIAKLYSEEEDELSTDMIDLKGGGGTRMSALVEMFQDDTDQDEPYDVAVIVTDGYLPEGDILNEYEGEIPLIVVITENGNVPGWLAENVTVIKMT